MMDRKLQDLRRRLAQIPRGRGRRIPAALRERIVTWTAERRARGAWWCELSRTLGVPAQTLKRWATHPPARALSLRPVDVVTDAPAPRTVTVVAPSGLRIEGVTLADALTLLRGLA